MSELKDVLVVVDMQNDFVTGSLGSEDAKAIVPNVVALIEEYAVAGKYIIFTKDTHLDNYFDTLEGKKLPVKHCGYGTEGWELIPELVQFSVGYRRNTILKETFGSILMLDNYLNDCSSIEFCGVCTDICVVSNALGARMFFPNKEISVRADACAGTSKEAHEAALTTMRSCQIDVI